ncbi:hypothetical protein GGR54DRAFT_594144 [Hypoxylon sp. NC1633]|nr:hypothetical protein GGR54DRAFT_594144 [Hypoxylon sp. NC1633]
MASPNEGSSAPDADAGHRPATVDLRSLLTKDDIINCMVTELGPVRKAIEETVRQVLSIPALVPVKIGIKIRVMDLDSDSGEWQFGRDYFWEKGSCQILTPMIEVLIHSDFHEGEQCEEYECTQRFAVQIHDLLFNGTRSEYYDNSFDLYFPSGIPSPVNGLISSCSFLFRHPPPAPSDFETYTDIKHVFLLVSGEVDPLRYISHELNNPGSWRDLNTWAATHNMQMP